MGSTTSSAARAAKVKEDVRDGFRESIQRLRQRYTLHYEMPIARPGEQRHVRVELIGDAARRHRGARISARTGYIVPGAGPRRN